MLADWTSDELTEIGDAEELDLASRRDDGTLHRPARMWVARIGDDLYVRFVNGCSGAWYLRVARVVPRRLIQRDAETPSHLTRQAPSSVDRGTRGSHGVTPLDLDTVTRSSL